VKDPVRWVGNKAVFIELFRGSGVTPSAFVVSAVPMMMFFSVSGVRVPS
jgi:hypothetical protein